jgi:hypothetical protein
VFKFTYHGLGRALVPGKSTKALESIQEQCAGITTIELSLDESGPSEGWFSWLQDVLEAAEVLNFLNRRFEAILSLENVVFNITKYGEQDLDDDLMEKLRQLGWITKVTKRKRVWISNDDRVEFGNEDDWNEYNDEMDALDLQRERKGETGMVRRVLQEKRRSVLQERFGLRLSSVSFT